MKRPPLIAGGQGRTARSVRDDATANILTILAFLAVVACLIIKAVRK